MQKRLVYRSYLVRLWPTQRAGVADYRVTVQMVSGVTQNAPWNDRSMRAHWTLSPSAVAVPMPMMGGFFA